MEDYSNYIGSWVVARWNFEADNGKPHPEDIELIDTIFSSGGTIAKCISTAGEFVILKARGVEFRLIPFSLVKTKKAPKFLWGQEVKVIDGHPIHSPYQSKVDGVAWHFNNQSYYYHLVGKKTKRYEESDLQETNT